MPADTVRMDRPEAVAIARAFVDLIDDCCERLVVAGSLRRRLASIGDVEIVAVPKVVTVEDGLFGDHLVGVNLLEQRLDGLLDAGEVDKRLDVNGKPRWGPTLKYVDFMGRRIDLFCPSAERFGWILLLRTGPAAFSRQLVVERGKRTKDGRPGLLPPHLAPRDGWLTRRVSGERLETRDERDVFELFAISFVEPWERE